MTTIEGPDGDLRTGAAVNVLIAVRLIHLTAYAADAASTPVTHRAEKSRLVDELVTATGAFATEVALPSHLHSVAALTNDETLTPACLDLLRGVRSRISDGDLRSVLVEVATSTNWPKGISWVEDRNSLLAQAAVVLDPNIKAEQIAWVEDTFRAIARRLRKDATSPVVQATQVAVTAALSIATAGAATGLGTFIGTHYLGLSGAAATSAGLAFVGGGSLASGGFGMLGGAFVLQLGVEAANHGGRLALSQLVSSAPDAFIDALARLDLLVVMDSTRLADTVAALESMRTGLSAELESVRPEDRAGRRGRVTLALLDTVARPIRIRAAVRDAFEEFSVEERRLARGLRAVDHELRHLRSSGWKRQAARIPRFLGVPSASQLLDRL